MYYLRLWALYACLKALDTDLETPLNVVHILIFKKVNRLEKTYILVISNSYVNNYLILVIVLILLTFDRAIFKMVQKSKCASPSKKRCMTWIRLKQDAPINIIVIWFDIQSPLLTHKTQNVPLEKLCSKDFLQIVLYYGFSIDKYHSYTNNCVLIRFYTGSSAITTTFLIFWHFPLSCRLSRIISINDNLNISPRGR